MASNDGETSETTCMYQKCQKKEDKLNPSSARVEVKSYVPDEKVDRSRFLVQWRGDGQAVFHGSCWKSLVKDTRGTGTYMAAEESQMVQEAQKTAEYYDSLEDIKKEGKRLAKMIQSASHVAVFTGAGISTSAGIGDFRGKGGAWTERDRAKKFGEATVMKEYKKRSFRYSDLRPTYTHEAIVKLIELGRVKYVISQNVDGIHRLSGVPRDRISELHGNTFHEKCELCDARYERTFYVGGKAPNVPAKPCSHCRINHRTGRKCERKQCDGYLMNTIINFGDNLESPVLDAAVDHSRRRDLMICLGSSLTVTPAANLVEYGKKPLRVVICNRQPTQYDELCYRKSEHTQETLGVRVFGDCDALMAEVMKGILSADDLAEWEEGRQNRMAEYDQQRTPDQ